MSEGFWSLRNAPKWWFDKRAWMFFGIALVILMGSRWYHGPGRVPEGKVVFYGSQSCPYSAALRGYLEASGIPFEERNVDASFGNLVRYSWASGRGGVLPVVQVGPRVVSKGFYRAPIDAALQRAGYRPVTVAVTEGSSRR